MSKISAPGAPGESPKESPEVIAPPSAEGDGAGGSSDPQPDEIYDSSDWEEPEESTEDSDIHERVFNPEPGNVSSPTASEQFVCCRLSFPSIDTFHTIYKKLHPFLALL